MCVFLGGERVHVCVWGGGCMCVFGGGGEGACACLEGGGRGRMCMLGGGEGACVGACNVTVGFGG